MPRSLLAALPLLLLACSGVGTGIITADGGTGTADTLYFAITGDTRPANENDTSGYPTAIANAIFQQINALKPAPSFVIGTGDYQYASPGGDQNMPQINLFMTARAGFDGPFWPVMGNHECTGGTDSNCSTSPTTNYMAFQSGMLTPIGETLPYYTRIISATDKSWSAKFIFAASNYWDTAQETWYQQQLQIASTYTFIIDHEINGSGSPGDEAIFSESANVPVTLHVVGHNHTWQRVGTQTLIVGNGGAPIGRPAPYGFSTFQRRTTDGAIVVTGYDYSTNAPASGEQFCIDASGTDVSTCP